MKQIIVLISFLLGTSIVSSQTDKWQAVSDVFNRAGTLKDNVYKIPFPRADLNVTVNGTKIAAGLALGGWVAFMDMDGMQMDANTMVMGDLVLLESEIAPVQSALLANGIKISAIHNHLLEESPKIMYMHIYGKGDKLKLAQGLRSALERSATILDTNLLPKVSTEPPDWSSVETTLGYKGSKKGSVINFGIPRNDVITENGTVIPPFMGVATAINFQMVDSRAFTTGDFVLTPDEVSGVMDALVSGGITVTALHSHMLFEQPRLFFMHFWGFDTPDTLVKTILSALEKTNYKRGG